VKILLNDNRVHINKASNRGETPLNIASRTYWNCKIIIKWWKNW